MESYELAWAERLAEEHAHQRELLATLHGELASFAGECAAALSALDALVSLGPVSTLLDGAETGARGLAVVRDVARRIPALARNAPREDPVSGFYTHLGGEDDLSLEVVHHAGELLRANSDRGDSVLLAAIVDVAGDRDRIRQAIGPGAVAALYAVGPLAHWAPSLATLAGQRGDRGAAVATARTDLAAVLEDVSRAAGEELAGETVELIDSLRYTVEHISETGRALTGSRLEHAIAEARKKLDADLHALRAIHEDAHAPHTWRTDRHAEHSALVEEVREKLEKVERIRAVLAAVLPRLQLAARALGAVERVRAVAGRIDARYASEVEAVRMWLLLTAGEVLAACLPDSRRPLRPPRPLPRRRLIAGAVVLAAAGAAIAVAVTQTGSNKAPAPNTILNVAPQLGTPPAPTVSPVRATFDPAQKATFYAISVAAPHQGKLVYAWHLAPPAGNPSCNSFGSVFGSPNRAVWHHAATDGCTHLGIQHLGTVTVTVRSRYWQCTASFFGSLTSKGLPPKACTRI